MAQSPEPDLATEIYNALYRLKFASVRRQSNAHAAREGRDKVMSILERHGLAPAEEAMTA